MNIEEIARKLHEWYLESTDLDNAEYNHKAVVPYDDLTEGQKAIDRYIAEKVVAMISSRDAEWVKVVEGIEIPIGNSFLKLKKAEAIQKMREWGGVYVQIRTTYP